MHLTQRHRRKCPSVAAYTIDATRGTLTPVVGSPYTEGVYIQIELGLSILPAGSRKRDQWLRRYLGLRDSRPAAR